MSVPYGQPPAAPQPGSTKSPIGDLALGKLLALAAGGLGLIIYFLTFSDDAGAYLRTSLLGVLLVGGGLLAAAAALPKAPATLVPASVSVVTGTLFLIIDVAKGPIFLAQAGQVTTPGLIIVALVLALLESAACVAALLAEAGLVKMPAPRPKPFPQQSWPQQQPGGGYYGGPGQGGYPGQPPSGVPGGVPGGYPPGAPQPQQAYSPPTVQYYPQQPGQQPQQPGQPGQAGHPGQQPGQPGGQPGQPGQGQPGQGAQPDQGNQPGQPGQAGQQYEAGQQYRPSGAPPNDYGSPGQS